MNDPAHNEWHRLFNAALNDTLAKEDKASLSHLLKTSAEARQLWFLYSDNECSLGELKPRQKAPVTESNPRRSSWFQWRPITAAAAGLVIGLFSATMLWGYVGPYAGKVIPLLQDSFETGPPPRVTGLPTEAGLWSGDYSQVVSETQGVKPASGSKMLRFLRADYEGKPRNDGYVADLFRIIDLRDDTHLHIDQGDASVSVEARFASLPQAGTRYADCGISVHAIDSLPSESERHEFLETLRNALPPAGGNPSASSGMSILAASARSLRLDTTKRVWQAGRSELQVPPGTRFLVVHFWLTDPRGPHEPQPAEFAGLFLDDVRILLNHKTPLP